MFKRILSMILCITLVCLIAMPVTAEETKETKETTETTRSMEEILNDYHAQSAALSTASSAAAAVYSRNATADPQEQLKQETIAELNAAGYSAYDVNPTTFSGLEETLQTDFSAMGLDPNGSYIIVISGEEGEEGEETPANGSRGLILPPHQWEDDTPGSNYFYYTYNGTTYQMRYMTVIGSYSNGLAARVEIDLINDFTGTEFEALMHSTVAVATSVVEGLLYLDTISALISYPTPEAEETDSMLFETGSVWNVKYMQVYNTGEEEWVSSASVECVTMYYSVTYTYLTVINGLGAYDSIYDESEHEVLYSEYYDDDEWIKLKAVQQYCYNPNYVYDDTIWEVEYFFLNPVNTDQVIYTLTVGRP